MESVTNHINYSVFDHNVNLLHKSFNVYKFFLLLLLLLSIGKNTVTRKMICEEIIGEYTVMDVVPGDTNTELLKETLADILIKLSAKKIPIHLILVTAIPKNKSVRKFIRLKITLYENLYE